MSEVTDAKKQRLAANVASQDNVPATNPYVFVVGCPRSGTTLLQRMLNSHPLLSVANDTHFIPRVLEKTNPAAIDNVLCGEPIPLTPKLASAVREYHRFARLGIDEHAITRAIESTSTYGQLVSQLYAELAQRDGKPYAGEKTPDYVRRLPLLHALCPRARFIHIYRDGRDVALSLRQWATPTKGPGRFTLWEAEPLAVCALWWSWLVNEGRKAGTRLGDSFYLAICYEQLVQDAPAVLSTISAFLDLPMASDMLTFHEGKTRTDEGLSAKKAWLPPTAGLRDWRSEMPKRDVQLFEALAGDTLDELGYERSTETIPADVLLSARRCQKWWDAEQARRQH